MTKVTKTKAAKGTKAITGFMKGSQRAAWLLWMIASIFYAYQYILRVMPNVMLQDIMRQFSMDPVKFGQFSGVYYIGYSLIHLPVGIMLDRYGPRRVMTVCILLTVIGLFPIIFATNFVYPLIGRALIGIGSSAAILGTFKIVRIAFIEERFTRMLSLAVTIGLIGAIYGGGPVSYMCQHLNYRVVIGIFAVIGVLLAALTYWLVPELEKSRQTVQLSDIRLVFANRKVLLFCCFAGLMVGPLEGFADVWGSEFLRQVYDLEGGAANYLPSMIFIGMCFGAPILSLIAEKTGRYFGSIIGAGVVMCCVFIMLIAGKLTVNVMMIGFVLVGVCCSYQILAIYKASMYVPEHVVTLTTAVANMIIMSFGYAFHSIIGFVIRAVGASNPVQAFVYGIGIIPLGLGIGVIGFSVLACQESQARKN